MKKKFSLSCKQIIMICCQFLNAHSVIHFKIHIQWYFRNVLASASWFLFSGCVKFNICGERPYSKNYENYCFPWLIGWKYIHFSLIHSKVLCFSFTKYQKDFISVNSCWCLVREKFCYACSNKIISWTFSVIFLCPNIQPNYQYYHASCAVIVEVKQISKKNKIPLFCQETIDFSIL